MVSLNVHHIGYLIKKIDAAAAQFEALGYEKTGDTVYDPVRLVHICFLQKDGYLIELISPAAPDSVVSGLMKKYKNSPYHICYSSAQFGIDLAALTESGYFAIDTPSPAPAIGGKQVVFLMHPALGMIELLEE